MIDDDRKRLAQLGSGVYLITPDDESDSLPLWSRLLPHCSAVQIRSTRIKRSKILAIKEICRQYSRPLLVNNRVDLCLELDTDGVHLGKSDSGIEAARNKLGSSKIIGVSCYRNLSYARSAIAAGADYVSFGACYPSRTKPEATVITDHSIFQRAQERFSCPVIAIGGVNKSNFSRLVLEYDVRSLAISAGIFSEPDPVRTLKYIVDHNCWNSI